jgi:hypothetical protein
MTTFNMTPNYEMSLFIAQATGSIFLTSSQTRWEEIQQAAKRGDQRWYDDLCASINDFDYPLGTDANKTIRLRVGSHSGSFRKALRDIDTRVRSNRDPSDAQKVERLTAALSGGLSAILAQLRSGDGLILNGKMRFQAPSNGFVDNNVQRLLLKSGSSHHLGAVSLAVFLEPQGPIEPG